jgi:hypothetical protein
MSNCDDLPPTERTECYVREYFESRGWSVDKLDRGKNKAADFHIHKNGNGFLCEVKTVESVHANLPWSPSLDVFESERKERQKSNERWMFENPDSRLILNPGEYEFVYGDAGKFRRKYQRRKRFTEKEFNDFAADMHRHFTQSARVRDLPFSVRLDSDDLSVPYGKEREQFYEWLETELLAINAREQVDRRWDIERLPDEATYRLSMFYPIHQVRIEKENDVNAPKKIENEVNADYQLAVTGPNPGRALELHIFGYGQLNLDAITQNVDSGLSQLQATVSREQFLELPQVIVLAFAGGLTFEWPELLTHVSWLLSENESLNAIAILDRETECEAPDPQENVVAFIGFGRVNPLETVFVLVHNTWHPNAHKETLQRVFDYHKNAHVESDSIGIPAAWLPD